MSTFRTHTTLPEEVRKALIARQKEALRQAAGAWKDKDHPKLKAGSAAWVKELRRESETRFQRPCGSAMNGISLVDRLLEGPAARFVPDHDYEMAAVSFVASGPRGK